MVSHRCHSPGEPHSFIQAQVIREAKRWDQLTSPRKQRKGTEWLSSMVFPVCNMVVARRLSLHPEEDSEEQHYEEEEDGATDSQGHNHLCVCSVI